MDDNVGKENGADAAVNQPVVNNNSTRSASGERSFSLDDKKREQQQAQAAAKEVSIPSPALDDELQNEIDSALADVSLVDVYGLDDAVDKAAAAVGGDLSERRDGVVKGKVVSVSDGDIFVDLGGKSQGYLPREELEEGQEVNVGDVVDVSIMRYDEKDGLVVLSMRSAAQQLLRRDLNVGAQVEARVTGTNKGGLELEIKGLKAFMPVSQIDIYRTEDTETLIGQKFICEVTQVERGDKNIVLSRRNILEKEREALRENIWEELAEGQMCQGVVRSIMDYGAFVDLGGVDGLLHVREMSWARVKHPKDILSEGQQIDVMIVSLDREKQRIGLSLRQAGGDPWTSAEYHYPVGGRVQAKITNLMDFGAFAELEPGVEGLIPISQMTWAGRIKHPSDVVKVGQLVEVEVAKVDTQQRRISLSMKSIQGNPWDDIEMKYRADDTYTGTVARVTDFGAFVTLEAGVDGLVHISELSDRHVSQVRDVVREGDTVKVRVLEVNPSQQRISLSMKVQAQGDVSDMPNREEAGPVGESVMRAAEDGQSRSEQARKKGKDRPRRGGLSW